MDSGRALRKKKSVSFSTEDVREFEAVSQKSKLERELKEKEERIEEIKKMLEDLDAVEKEQQEELERNIAKFRSGLNPNTSGTTSEPGGAPQRMKSHVLSTMNLLQEEPMTAAPIGGAEANRLKIEALRQANWKLWGPYLSDRQWGTVREDYSQDGNTWGYFTHDQSRSRAYRWGEDGILGITDRENRLCFGLCMWNGKDPILKERFFGVTGPEGNHGEDVKEYYFYQDSTPTHSYMKALYKYPQEAYPYSLIIDKNRERTREEPEFELLDSGVFDQSRYFDVQIEYAKNTPTDILIRTEISNRGDQSAPFHFLPTIWFRNTWVWGSDSEGYWAKPKIHVDSNSTTGRLTIHHESLGDYFFEVETMAAEIEVRPRIAKHLTQPAEWLFTDNETNTEVLWGAANRNPYVKDAFHNYVIHGKRSVNPSKIGTKAAAYHVLDVPAGQTVVLNMRMHSKKDKVVDAFDRNFETIFNRRIAEANDFYTQKINASLTPEEKKISRNAFAGLLWTKQFYNYNVRDWLHGDHNMPPPPAARKEGRNSDWPHLYNRDVISMPDKWEYPWYAVWDLAFHTVTFALIDPYFAKQQLLLILREWYMHPNGALPAYEFAFSDVNPPVHAWACWRVYRISAREKKPDKVFLARAFQKLLMNFTWWVNRKDVSGKHIFSGGFLGLDNIGVFDRSKYHIPGGHLEQADGTAWMGFYCIYMLKIALELAQDDLIYEDVASKFFEHFLSITNAMNHMGGSGLWDPVSGFYYDQLQVNGVALPLSIRSLVGIVPFFAVGNIATKILTEGFTRRTQWFMENVPEADQVTYAEHRDDNEAAYILSILNKEKLLKVLAYVLDENEFFSKYGIRSLSKYHLDHPFRLEIGSEKFSVSYVPGESNSALFGGNSNWRGPIWFPMNFLLMECLQRYHNFYGHDTKIQCPTGSGKMMCLAEVGYELNTRLVKLFLPDENGVRPCHGANKIWSTDPHWKEHILFYEYFHGETGEGLGASHQTGWTALVASCLDEIGTKREKGFHGNH